MRTCCAIAGCDNKGHFRRGLCNTHFTRLRRNGSPYVVSTCSVEGCDGEHEAKGLCKSHYERLRKHGTLEDCSVKGCRQVPRTEDGLCITHDRKRKREQAARFPMWFPIAPFCSTLRALGYAHSALTPHLRRNLYRGDYVSWPVADKLACAIGLHPIEIWPEWVPDEPQLELFEDDAA